MQLFEPLTLAIGLRYLRAKRRNRFISFISAASILGIIIGVIALITTIAVMSGFQQEIRERILGTVAHATIAGVGEPLTDWNGAITLAEQDSRIVGAAPYVEREVMLSASRNHGALIRGIEPSRESQVSEFNKKVVSGSFETLTPGSFNIVIGSQLAMQLGVNVGDKITVYFAEFRASPVGALPQFKRFTVSGIFEIGEQTADVGLGLVHMRDAQRVLRMGNEVSGIRLKLADLWQAADVARTLSDKIGGFHQVRDWMRDNQNFFGALKLEKTVMFILLSLVVGIAAFNLVSSLVMLVQDKQADIAILRTLGLSPVQVMQVFIVQGSVIGVVGTLVGVVLGVTLALNLSVVVKAIENITGSELMPSEVYYISGVPTAVYPTDVVIVTLVALGLSFLATIYPAWRASRTDPTSALRYE